MIAWLAYQPESGGKKPKAKQILALVTSFPRSEAQREKVSPKPLVCGKTPKPDSLLISAIWSMYSTYSIYRNQPKPLQNNLLVANRL